MLRERDMESASPPRGQLRLVWDRDWEERRRRRIEALLCELAEYGADDDVRLNCEREGGVEEEACAPDGLIPAPPASGERLATGAGRPGSGAP